MRPTIAACGLASLASFGAGIAVVADEGPTYRKDIAPVIASKCVSCHSPGGAGPFRLLSYEDVRKRAGLLEVVTLQQKSAPMDATSSFGALSIHPKLTDNEALQIQEWIRGGMTEGTGEIAEPKLESGWRFGEPNEVIQITPINIPPEGNEIIKETVVPLNLDRNRELIAFDVIPKSPKVARQIVVATQGPNEYSPFKSGGIRAKQLVGAWAVGYRPWKLPEDASVILKPGDRLCIRMLYHPSGKRDDGSFDLALYYADKPRPRHPVWMTIGSDQLDISGAEPYYTDVEARRILEA